MNKQAHRIYLSTVAEASPAGKGSVRGNLAVCVSLDMPRASVCEGGSSLRNTSCPPQASHESSTASKSISHSPDRSPDDGSSESGDGGMEMERIAEEGAVDEEEEEGGKGEGGNGGWRRSSSGSSTPSSGGQRSQHASHSPRSASASPRSSGGEGW
jgi:hypothetical protein